MNELLRKFVLSLVRPLTQKCVTVIILQNVLVELLWRSSTLQHVSLTSFYDAISCVTLLSGGYLYLWLKTWNVTGQMQIVSLASPVWVLILWFLSMMNISLPAFSKFITFISSSLYSKWLYGHVLLILISYCTLFVGILECFISFFLALI
uniref:Cytochrome c biogenesis protein n=2 Tax=Chromera velia TaxID=505693 RepID=D9IXJ8_9ALVE|nr:cytochrome c biogenesis protein [Chromera velia]ADJ66526.1 cytochrome c biogenesis protein [Chromera velia]